MAAGGIEAEPFCGICAGCNRVFRLDFGGNAASLLFGFCRIYESLTRNKPAIRRLFHIFKCFIFIAGEFPTFSARISNDYFMFILSTNSVYNKFQIDSGDPSLIPKCYSLNKLSL